MSFFEFLFFLHENYKNLFQKTELILIIFIQRQRGGGHAIFFQKLHENYN